MANNFAVFKQKTKSVEEWLQKEYRGIRTGRATPAILDSLRIEVYGSKMPIHQVASITVEDPRTLRISPWDKTQIKEIEKGIQTSNLGLSVAVDDVGIRVAFPELTAERRGDFVKVAKEKLEEAKVSLRREREEVWDNLQEQEKDSKISEDEKFRGKDEMQKIVDESNKNLETLFEKKEKEILV